ncbi:MAG: hypothetical protein IKO15_07720, partial [Clostridiales bacterium]|nr:hypothetical protein [Clostridiales bacterium]
MFKLVKAHFHKDKAVLLAFLLILIVASMLLHVGLMVGRFDSMYDENLEKRNVPDAMFFVVGDEDKINDTVNGLDYVKSHYLSELINPDMVTVKINSRKEKDIEDLFFIDQENEAVYQNLHYIEKDNTITGPAICVNVYTAYAEGMRVGDKVRISHADLGDYEFTVAGIYEDLFCGQMYSYYSTVIDHESYEKINEKAESVAVAGKMPYAMQFLCVSFEDNADISISTTAVQEAVTKEGFYCNGYNVTLAKAGYTGITNIVAAFMAAFSAIIMAIAFIMIIFTVNTNINRDIRNIGALRAVGFTISQVRMSLMI